MLKEGVSAQWVFTLVITHYHGGNLTQMKQGVNWRQGPMWSGKLQAEGQSDAIGKEFVPLRLMS